MAPFYMASGRYHAALAACLVLASAFGAATIGFAAEVPGGFVSGATLDNQLATPVSVSWSNTPLRQALKSLSASQHVAIVLDRRVDPDQRVQLLLSQEPLSKCLERIAEHLHLGYCQFGPVAYFGPIEMARRLRTLAAQRLEEVRPLGNTGARKLIELRTSHWDELAEPRQLVDDLAAEAGVKLVGGEKIPHDLWPEADLPPLTWIDRLTLLAAQFDLTYKVLDNGHTVELVAAPPEPTLVRTYPAGKDIKAVEKRWAKALPEAKLSIEGSTIRLEGRWEDHELVEHRFRGAPTQRATVTAGKEVYQLTIDNTALDRVVQQLGQRLNLDFQWDRTAIDAAGISTEQIVSIKVQQATLDDLIAAVLKGTGLAYRRKDRVISIYPTAAQPPAAK